jgi:hypothetical protein
MIDRRLFVGTVALGILAAPIVGEPQQGWKIARVGILAAGSASEAPNLAFLDRMQELGYVEGRTVVFERRFAAGKIERLPTLASQLVTTRPNVIFAPVTPAALAARTATRTIPIVFAVSADPVGAGLVSSLRQPAPGSASRRKIRRRCSRSSGGLGRARPSRRNRARARSVSEVRRDARGENPRAQRGGRGLDVHDPGAP